MKIQTERIVCRFSPAELAAIDERRGALARATYVRLAALDTLPKQVPAINREAWVNLARSAANLNQIAKHLNGGGSIAFDDCMHLLIEFREALISARPTVDEQF